MAQLYTESQYLIGSSQPNKDNSIGSNGWDMSYIYVASQQQKQVKTINARLNFHQMSVVHLLSRKDRILSQL